MPRGVAAQEAVAWDIQLSMQEVQVGVECGVGKAARQRSWAIQPVSAAGWTPATLALKEFDGLLDERVVRDPGSAALCRLGRKRARGLSPTPPRPSPRGGGGMGLSLR